MTYDELVDYCKEAGQTISELDYKNRILEKENQELKKHLKVSKTCNLKTLEDYKSYYEDTTREQILEDTYIEYCAYVNLAHRYSELKKQVEEYQKALDETMSEKIDIQNNWNKLKEWIKVRDNIGLEKICLENIVYEMQEIEESE